jgi:hypothetical protein
MLWFALLLVAVVAAGACSDEPPLPRDGHGHGQRRATGTLELGLEVADGVIVQTVQYSIQGGPEGETLNGEINVSQPGSTASVERFGLLPGDYSIDMTAESEDGSTTCEGSADFVIIAGEITEVTVILECTGGERFGGVRVNAELRRCLELTSVVVSPLQVAVGYDIDVSALAEGHDPSLIAYQWSANVGSFADPSSPDTTYRCEVAGDVELVVTAIARDDQDCSDSFGVVVTCGRAPLCGNQQVDEGEQCDPPDGVTCDEACQTISSSCGDGFIDQGETCDPPDGVFCDDDCQRINPCRDPSVCDDQNDCTTDTCTPDPADNSAVCGHQDAPNGDSCELGAGICDDGECIVEDTSITAQIPVVCRDNVFGNLFQTSFALRANPLGPVTPGVDVDVQFSGAATVPRNALQAAIEALPGLSEITLTDLLVTSEIRSGASGDAPAMGSNLALPALIPLNIQNDATVCAEQGLPTPCVVQPLQIPFAPTIATLTPGSDSNQILIGLSQGSLPNTIDLSEPAGPVGVRLQAVVLLMGTECTMGRLVNGEVATVPDSDLLAIPIGVGRAAP